MPIFKRRNDHPQPAAAGPDTSATPSDGFNPERMRGLLFDALANRIGNDNADAMREDFDKHIAADPQHGVEAAYLCMMGKMVDFIDVLNDEVEGKLGPSSGSSSVGASPFTVYRKDV